MPGLVRVALTGGIATGKSACLSRLAELGAATLDADVLARQAVEPGRPALSAIVARFGRAILAADGALDRQALGRIVFADESARRDLEAIVHPAVYASITRWFDELTARRPPEGTARIVAVADIPLLYETGRERDFDRVIVAACRPDQQLARLVARDGLDEAAARARIAAQWPLEDKVRRADFVIDTSGTLEETRAGVDRVWRALSASKSSA